MSLQKTYVVTDIHVDPMEYGAVTIHLHQTPGAESAELVLSGYDTRSLVLKEGDRVSVSITNLSREPST